MKIIKDWRNDYTRLFLIDKGKPQFLHCIGVQSVLWPDESSQGKVVLKGRMPAAKDLLQFPEGAGLSVLDGLCRDPAEYDMSYEIMRFDKCHVVRKWITRLSSDTGPGETVYLRLMLDCEIRVTADG